MMDENALSSEVIGAAIEVHRHLGPGLLESIYRDCLVHELRLRGFQVAQEVTLPVTYKGREFSAAYRADVVVEDRLVVELKAVEIVLPVFSAQLLSYLRISGKKLGLLINFNVPREGRRQALG
ncbi:MAG TPA: GxxExxY protein [Burkholderiales bacterium]